MQVSTGETYILLLVLRVAMTLVELILHSNINQGKGSSIHTPDVNQFLQATLAHSSVYDIERE